MNDSQRATYKKNSLQDREAIKETNFSIKERKKMTSGVLKELRKKLKSQSDVETKAKKRREFSKMEKEVSSS